MQPGYAIIQDTGGACGRGAGNWKESGVKRLELRREYEELKEKIDYHSHLYYDLDAPELDDFEFDALTRRL